MIDEWPFKGVPVPQSRQPIQLSAESMDLFFSGKCSPESPIVKMAKSREFAVKMMVDEEVPAF
jgi:hypothetical protein